MYSKPWRDAFEGRYHDWPKWNKERSITDIANKIIEEHQIKNGDTLIGTSLGGIVACEVANLLDLEQIILIGSALSKEEINGVLSVLHPLIDLAPLSFIQMSSGKLPSDLAGMFRSSDPSFIRNMSKAIFCWKGLYNETSILRIHGTKDLVIPKPSSVDHTIEGGHLIVMTHPLKCIQYIKESSL